MFRFWRDGPLGLNTATQEKPRRTSGHRSDMIVWIDRLALLPFLAIELKTPSTPINDPVFFADALVWRRAIVDRRCGGLCINYGAISATLSQ